MKIINFISALLVITICFAMCFMVGCKSNNATSDDLSSVTSEPIADENSATEGSESTDETDVTTSTENTVGSSENDVVNDNSSVVEDTPVVSTPSVSTPVETPSEDVPSEDETPSVDTSTPSDCVENTPTYPTVTLYQRTTYYGFDGVFTLMDEENPENIINLADYGLGTADETGISYPSEYYDVVTGNSIRFICHPSILPVDIMGYIDEVGRSSTPANVIY